jgi:hypothetical protein
MKISIEINTDTIGSPEYGINIGYGVNPSPRFSPFCRQQSDYKIIAHLKGAKESFFRARKGHQNANPGINLPIQKRKGPVFEG